MDHSHSKRRRRLASDRKGYSGIIATIFMVLVILFLYFNVYAFMVNRNTAFQDTASQVAQMNVDRSTETLAVSNVTPPSVSGSNVNVNCNIDNTGPLSVQLVSLWVKDLNLNDALSQNYNWTSVSEVLQPGGSAAFSGAVSIANSKPGDQFALWFVTARGNVVSQSTTGATQGTGPVVVNFDQFRQYTLSGNVGGQDIGSPTSSLSIANYSYTIIAALLTNVDPSGQTITLASGSYVWAPTFSSSAMNAYSWPIANVVNNVYQQNFGSQNLSPGIPTWVYFGPTKPLNASGVLPLSIVLFGELGSSDYGQNIPFVSADFYHTRYQVVFSGSGYSDATGNLLTFSVSGGQFSGATSPIGVSGGSIIVDAGASVSYSFASPVSSSVGGKQYRWSSTTGTGSASGKTAQSDSFTVNSAGTVTASYVAQWNVIFAVSPTGGGSTNPNGAVWWDAASSQPISATPTPGYTFAQWLFSGTGSVTFANSHSASTTATINGAGTVTATFTANLGIDGTTSLSFTSGMGSNTIQISLTTTKPNDLLYFSLVEGSPQTVNGITSSPSIPFTSWTQRANVVIPTSANPTRLETWYTTWSSSGTITITITLAGPSYTHWAIVAFAVSGASTTSPFDGVARTNISGSSPGSATASVSITTSKTGDLLIGAVGAEQIYPLTTGTGFNLIGTRAYTDNYQRETSDEYQIVSTTGTYPAGYTFSQSTTWAMVGEAIKPAAP